MKNNSVSPTRHLIRFIFTVAIAGTLGGALGGALRGPAGTSLAFAGDPSQQPPLGCTLTQGFWKNHEPEVLALVPGSMNLGSTAYTAAELDSILGQAVAGNALLILAHQLIAAQLNDLNGADVSGIAADLANANSLIGSLVVPPIGAGSVDPSSVLGQQMVTVAATLDNFNNGNTSVPHCP